MDERVVHMNMTFYNVTLEVAERIFNAAVDSARTVTVSVEYTDPRNDEKENRKW